MERLACQLTMLKQLDIYRQDRGDKEEEEGLEEEEGEEGESLDLSLTL